MKKLLLVFLLMFSSPLFASGINANSASAPCDNATLSKYTGTANVEINWEPNTINLNWYDGDTKLTVANSAQSCVYDSTLTVPAQPTKPGYTFNGWKVIHVPGGFTELEYIDFCTTCQIDTQKRIGANFEIYATIMYYSTMGYVFQSTSYEDFLVAYYNADCFYSYVSGAASNGCIGIPGTGTKFTFGISPEWVQYYTGTRRDLVRPYTGNSNLIVGYGSNSMSMRVYNVKMYNSGNLDLNLIPAKRNSDGVLGMYDSISGQFFTNSGTGTFTAGPVVE